LANDVFKRLVGQPGFRNHLDGFITDSYELGGDHWTDVSS
jgi:hypothetical protein